MENDSVKLFQILYSDDIEIEKINLILSKYENKNTLLFVDELIKYNYIYVKKIIVYFFENNLDNKIIYLLCSKFLIEVCENNDINFLRYLLITKKNLIENSKFFNINMQNKNKETPLFILTKYNNYEFVKILLTFKNIEVNFQNLLGETSLFLSCKYGDIETFKLLMKNEKINVNVKNNDGMSVLYYACEYDRIEFVKILLDNKNLVIE